MKKLLIIFMLLLLVLGSVASVRRSVGQQGLAWIEPPIIEVNVCENFTISIIVDTDFDKTAFEFNLTFDPTQMAALEVEFMAPWIIISTTIGTGYVFVVGTALILEPPGPSHLVDIKFHCDAAGISDLRFEYFLVYDEFGEPWSIPWEGAIVTQTEWYWKLGNLTDYAPSGVPDFDQRQDNWTNPITGQWSYCGPTAVANSLWWMDSKFEPNPVPPPTINDNFPLVQSYDSSWDDHDPQNVQPFIQHLAWFMDTDGQRTGLQHNGTNVLDMQAGIAQYLSWSGVNPEGDVNGDGVVSWVDLMIIYNAFGSIPGDPNWDLRADINGDNIVNIVDMYRAAGNYGKFGMFYEKTVKMPSFDFIEYEVERCEDVILLLGFWQFNNQTGQWQRIGGHYITVAGVDSVNRRIAFSDPIQDMAEINNLGTPFVPVPHPSPHGPTIHNNATLVSHDPCSAGPSGSPGGIWGPVDYETYEILNFIGQNFPEEYEQNAGNYIPEQTIFTEVEYAVIVSPTEWYWKSKDLMDYAPSGVPDFDQRQDAWINPISGTWTWCGPTAVSNSLWWLDSNFEIGNTPPPEISDTFALVKAYNSSWDDHDPRNVIPFIQHLGWFMDTDGNRTGLWPHFGTSPMDMQAGIAQYLSWTGLNPQGDANGDGIVNDEDIIIVQNSLGSVPGDPNWNLSADLNGDNVVNTDDLDIVIANYGNFSGKFYEKTVKMPSFSYIESEIEKCEDVILLLGFWQIDSDGYWWRIGGHYVTAAGVDSTGGRLAISDPGRDHAEKLYPGIVLPPEDHNHTGPPETIHNNATFVSHDFFNVAPSPSPGGKYGLVDYYPDLDFVSNYIGINFPKEFEEFYRDYIDPSQPIYVEIEYAIVVSCRTGFVAAGSEDNNLYVWDFYGNLLWQQNLSYPVVSVAMDNNANFIAAGTRSSSAPVTGDLWLFNNGGGLLWKKANINVSTSYDGGWAGSESKSVDVKYNSYNGYVVVAAATDQGLYLFDQAGNQIFHFDHNATGVYWPDETIVRISQDGNYIVCASYNSGMVHYFSHLRDGVPGWQPTDGTPLYTTGVDINAFWVAISGDGTYVAVTGGGRIYFINNTAASWAGAWVWWANLPKPGYWRVDMPCHGRAIVAVNDDDTDTQGCDLLYWDDGGDGWDATDSTPLWSYWPGKETGGGQTPTDDFYTVTISENGNYIATGGAPSNVYMLNNTGVLKQVISATPNSTVQSVDLTFSGKYGAMGDAAGILWFFEKDSGLQWNWITGGTIHSVVVSKLYPCMYPYPNHDLAVTNVTSNASVVNLGDTIEVNITVTNEGNFSESNFAVTLQVFRNTNETVTENDEALIRDLLEFTVLDPGESITITFSWNTTGMNKGNYTILGRVSIVHDEIDVYDNIYIDNIVLVRWPYDNTGDGYCGIDDIVHVAEHFGTEPGGPPNSQGYYYDIVYDINLDDYIGIDDVVLIAEHFGEMDP